MAIFRPGPLIGAISGPIGGVAFVVASKGTIVRQRRRRTSRTTVNLQRSQSVFTATLRLWPKMLPSTRAAWNAAASNYTLPNRLGEHVHLSGFQLYMKFRRNSVLANDLINFLPPSLSAQATIKFTTAVVTSGGPFSVQVIRIAPSIYSFVDVWAARPFTSSPRTFLRYHKLQLSYAPLTAFVDIWNSFVTRFGAPSPGETVGVRLIPANQGTISPPPIDAILTVQA